MMGNEFNIKELSYEAAMSHLERICDYLQSGKLDLESAVEAFELGTKLRKHARSKLVEAKLKVDIVGEETVQTVAESISEMTNSLNEAVVSHYTNHDLESIHKSIDLYRDRLTHMYMSDSELAKLSTKQKATRSKSSEQ